ncbi:hypothetical protein CEXT_188961 [Caerostris extrusa]|uniref:Uncharacterized protein n=1 Tax=Caerostris extrusa TaxID=172846 RepID=A0AAV4NMY6_CAEEX|nr:hypothetical protein CEXT_188961 [Caerostris extrusa]
MDKIMTLFKLKAIRTKSRGSIAVLFVLPKFRCRLKNGNICSVVPLPLSGTCHAPRLPCKIPFVSFAAEKSAAAPQGVTSATRPAASAPPENSLRSPSF